MQEQTFVVIYLFISSLPPSARNSDSTGKEPVPHRGDPRVWKKHEQTITTKDPPVGTPTSPF